MIIIIMTIIIVVLCIITTNNNNNNDNHSNNNVDVNINDTNSIHSDNIKTTTILCIGELGLRANLMCEGCRIPQYEPYGI